MSDEPIEITSVPCPNCGHPIPIGETHCEGCDFGTPSEKPKDKVSIFVRPKRQDPEPIEEPDVPPVLESPRTSIPPRSTWPCPNCGRPIPAGTHYCANCGSGSRSYVTQRKPQNWTSLYIVFALLLCPLACCGACFMPPSMSDWTTPFILVAVVGALIAIGMMIRDRMNQ